MSKDPRVYLAHILECIQKIERFTAPGKRRFLRDVLIHQYAGVDIPTSRRNVAARSKGVEHEPEGTGTARFAMPIGANREELGYGG